MLEKRKLDIKTQPIPKASFRSNTPVRKSLAYGFMGVEIEINHDCNRACAYCPNSKLVRKNQGQMSESLFLALLRQLQEIDYRGRVSYHFYNEPLLSPNLDRFVDLTREMLPETWIEIYTNGTLLTEERLRTLLRLGVDKFIVTKHHGSKVYPFEQTYRGLDRETQEKVKFQTYKEVQLTSRGGLVRVGSANRKPPLDLPCLIPSSVIVITVNGNVLPCFEDYTEQNVMGNLTENSLMDIWNSQKYRSFREDLKARKRSAHPVCKDCNHTLIII
jgi:radical SAM protein with 4Fe4S-binding SPASM domain